MTPHTNNIALAQTVEDWPAVQTRWAAWWQGELVDRVVIQVTAPRDKPAGTPGEGLEVDPVTQWTDAGFMIRRTEEALRSTYFGGDAIPWCWNPISAGHALYFGCAPHFAPDTMWVDPVPHGEDEFPTLDGWRDSPAWRWACECMAAFSSASQGRFFVLPFWGNHVGDILAMVRGVDRFYLDFALHPGWVVSTVQEMSDILIEVHEALWELAYSSTTGVEGSLNYCGCWSPLKTLAFDCDVSCNVSDEMFRRVFLQPLVESMQRVDHRIYHLDGRGALHHLDTLLDLPELHAIQWVPGAGHEAVGQWIPLIQHVQRKGKSIQVICEPEEVKLLLANVKPQGLCINTHCRTEYEARDLMALATRLS